MADIRELLEIMARLRDPDGGCPWDLAQDFASISPHTIEEAYEVDEAVASGDLEALRDELGDLLFQVVFQSRIAEEQQAFDFSGVVDAIVDKLVRRHPHIFADGHAPRTAEQQRQSWEAIKAAERAGTAGVEGEQDPFAGIPRKLPALARASKVIGRIDRMEGKSPENESLQHALERLVASAEAISKRLGSRPPPETAPSSASTQTGGVSAADSDEALGRLIGAGLREWVRLARRLGVDPECALRDLDDETIARLRTNVHQASNFTHR
jgi:ATP diphosphatase